MADKTAAPEGKPEGPAEGKVFETFAFGSVVDRDVVTITFPGMEAKWFVAARAPDAQGAKRIQAAPLKFTDSEDGGLELSPNTYAAYIAKCEAQITDFCLPRLNERGECVGEVRFDHKFPSANKTVYDSFNDATMRYVEGALDKIGGRETGLAEEFEAIKNASKPSAKSG